MNTPAPDNDSLQPAPGPLNGIGDDQLWGVTREHKGAAAVAHG